ncbi:acyltransferase [Spongiactinospora sp. TRM90649]|uniref:acyltransferase family protein n=1 Tax=Spongiactinospora sp. TRM90649 TaxID=3031114 RepID=UPI0023F872EB|nr:acyltransferase [Spongiactinospora sp. TRM90649]MDF5751057.1 acyltransferase [Spongiactinospora sp. TRM90649]
MTERNSAAISGTAAAVPREGAADLPAVDGHLGALDGVRAVAALVVLVYHVAAQTGAAFQPGFLGALMSRGDLGVPVFFLLSGLLLYRPWARAAMYGTVGPAARAYLWRRALRILPAYWLVVVVAMLWWGRAREPLDWAPLLLLAQNYVPDPWWQGLGPPGLGQMWSLSVEVGFYLVLPLIAVGLRAFAIKGSGDPRARARRLLMGIGALASISLLWTIPMHAGDARPELGLWLPRPIIYFCAGMALAVITLWARAEPDPAAGVRRLIAAVAQSWVTCWVIAAMVLAVAATPITGGRFFELQDAWTDVFETVLYTAFVVALLSPVAFLPARPSALGALLGNGVMRYLGRISYGIFLWQFVVILGYYRLTGQPDFTGDLITGLVVCAVVTIVLADLSYRLVEAPVLRLGGRRGGSAGSTRAG